LKNRVNLTAKQNLKKEELTLAKLSLKSIKAMTIRETFQQIYAVDTPAEFERLLRQCTGG